MYKIAILGCENSHANTFLDYIIRDNLYTDIDVVGVYSDDTAAAERLSKTYGIYAAGSYDEFVGKLHGVVITSRHGGTHYKFAKPYIGSGIPMFIDKPITISEKEAVELKNDLIKNNVKVCGGSVLKFADVVCEMKKTVREKIYGRVYGGYLRAPVNMSNDYGDFFFYSQHLVQQMCEIFGYYPNSVKTHVNNDILNCTVRYDEYDVNLVFVDSSLEYYAGINCAQKAELREISLDGCFEREFESFYRILKGNEQEESYENFIAPVFILNAIDRSMKSGNEEKILRQENM